MAAFKDLSGLKDLGDYIREQRKSSEISLRQLAAMAGVSNPYLSQIERGLRKPSADILAQIAKGLSVSAEAMYVQAGILDERAGDPHVTAAIMSDQGLTDRQKHVLLEIYDSFAAENDERRDRDRGQPPAPAAEVPVEATEPVQTSARKATTKTAATKTAKKAAPRKSTARKTTGTARKSTGTARKTTGTARKTAARTTAKKAGGTTG